LVLGFKRLVRVQGKILGGVAGAKATLKSSVCRGKVPSFLWLLIPLGEQMVTTANGINIGFTIALISVAKHSPTHFVKRKFLLGN
jgi:hypothetical protein